MSDIRDMADRFHRRSIRLRGYDYANAGAYYLTICTHERLNSFGCITDGMMNPSPLGDIVQRCWHAIPEHMPHADVGEFVVMPDHVHGIVIIRRSVAGAGHVGARHDAPLRNAPPTDPRKPPGIPRGALSQIVASFKSAVTRAAYHDGLVVRGTRVWQRGYYDHIIRDAASHARIARYIRDNPSNWKVSDKEVGRLP